MKCHSVFACRKPAIYGFLFSLGWMLVGSVSAQNLINNPSFNDPIATSASVLTNWTVAYVYGGPDDFSLRDRTTFAKRSGASGFGAQLRPATEGSMQAYFKQTVPFLLPGTNYVVSGWMMVTWPSGTTAVPPKYNVYIETVGGAGTFSTTYCTSSTWTQFAVTNTAKGNGTIDVRLQFAKTQDTVVTDNKMKECSGCWDDISVTKL